MFQPIDILMTRLELSNADLVLASTEQLSFKNVQKARTGHRVTPNIQEKILTALLKLKPELKLARRDLFRYDIGEDAVKAIHKAKDSIAAGKIDYPQFVDKLLEAGITRYQVEVSHNRITFFGTGGEAHVEQGPAILYESVGRYDVDALRVAITDAQKRLIDHPSFLKRIHAAGIHTYESNLRSREIRYRGEKLSYKELIPLANAVPKVVTPKPAAQKKKKSKVVKVSNSLKARHNAKKSWRKRR